MSKVLNKDTFYPLGDYFNAPSNIFKLQQYRAKWTGEKRAPKKGEWYLSGAIIEAYKAPNDLTHEHYIAKIYKVRKVEYWEEIGEA